MNDCIFSPDRIYRYVLRCQCAPPFTGAALITQPAGSNSDGVHHQNPLAFHCSASPKSTLKNNLSKLGSPTMLSSTQCRPRKRGALDQEDLSEDGKMKRRIAWIGLNPSTADEVSLDQTLTSVCRYSRRWGFSEVVMLNLFAFRATHPRDLKRASEPIGPDNDEHLLTEISSVDRVIACWGDQGNFLGRDTQVSALLKVPLQCLSRNRTGAPHHPLYLKSSIRPKPFS
jgi:hypothetical protein